MFQHNFCPPLLPSLVDEAHFMFNRAGAASAGLACLPACLPATLLRVASCSSPLWTTRRGGAVVATETSIASRHALDGGGREREREREERRRYSFRGKPGALNRRF